MDVHSTNRLCCNRYVVRIQADPDRRHGIHVAGVGSVVDIWRDTYDNPGNKVERYHFTIQEWGLMEITIESSIGCFINLITED